MQSQFSSEQLRDISLPAIDEINHLHDEILGQARLSLNHAIRIGELLTQVKAVLKHGEFSQWIEDNLPFTIRTSQNYMRLYDQRDRFKNENVSHLSQAYALIWSANGEVTKSEPQRLHEPNFHSQAVRLRQNLVALFNHHLQRRPLKVWHTEEVYDLYCSLQPMTEICSQLQLELDSRDDVPAAYRQTNPG